MTVRKNCANVGLLQDVAPDTSNDEIFVRHNRQVAGAHVQKSQICPADFAGQLCANVDGYLLSAKQSNLTAEERKDFRAHTGTTGWRTEYAAGESEDAGIFEKE